MSGISGNISVGTQKCVALTWENIVSLHINSVNEIGITFNIVDKQKSGEMQPCWYVVAIHIFPVQDYFDAENCKKTTFRLKNVSKPTQNY